MSSANNLSSSPYNTNDYPPGNDRPKGNTNNRARVGGSGFTIFVWNEKPISFARQISHQAPQPVAQGVVPIHPLDSPYPVQLVTPQALTMGTIVLELYELYGANIWQRLSQDFVPASGGLVDLAGLFRTVAALARPIHIFRVVSPPVQFGGNAAGTAYTEEYHNCVISSVDNGETIEVGTMEVLKQLTVNYTHITQGGKNLMLNEALNDALAGSTLLAPPGAVQG